MSENILIVNHITKAKEAIYGKRIVGGSGCLVVVAQWQSTPRVQGSISGACQSFHFLVSAS